MAVVAVAAKIGYAASVTNPVALAIAQPLAGVPVFSGMLVRFGVFVLFLSLGIGFVLLYVRKVAPSPGDRIVAALNAPRLSPRQIGVLLTLLAGSVGLIVGARLWDWGNPELAAFYVAISVAIALVGGLRAGQAADVFVEGMKSMMLACLLVGLAASVEIILRDSQVLDTIIAGATQLARGHGPPVVANALMAIEMGLDVVIPSVSGKATLSIPIPGADRPRLWRRRTDAGRRLPAGQRPDEHGHPDLRDAFGLSGHSQGRLPAMAEVHRPADGGAGDIGDGHPGSGGGAAVSDTGDEASAPFLAPDDVHVTHDVMITMRDGVRLATDIYRPAIDGRPIDTPLPVLLERTPYDKLGTNHGDRTRDDPTPRSKPELAVDFARGGYVVALQDCRGRYGSEGVFEKYLNEGPDGVDTIAWLAKQPWCDGRVATLGLSYGAHVQSALACLAPPALAAMFLDSGGFSSAFHSGIRQGGAFELKQATWAYKHALLSPATKADPARLAALKAEDLRAWFKRMPWSEGQSPLAAAPEYENTFWINGEAPVRPLLGTERPLRGWRLRRLCRRADGSYE